MGKNDDDFIYGFLILFGSVFALYLIVCLILYMLILIPIALVIYAVYMHYSNSDPRNNMVHYNPPAQLPERCESITVINNYNTENKTDHVVCESCGTKWNH